MSILILAQINNPIICASQKPIPTVSSSTARAFKTRSKGELAREIAHLRSRLASHSSGEELDIDIEAGSSRARSNSLTLPESKDQIEFNRTVSDSISRQTNLQERLAHAQEQQTRFQDRVYKDINYSRKTAVIGAVVSIAYTTAGFIWQNWPAISAAFGHHHGGGAGSGTNSTGV